jgi:hypothetical protein
MILPNMAEGSIVYIPPKTITGQLQTGYHPRLFRRWKIEVSSCPQNTKLADCACVKQRSSSKRHKYRIDLSLLAFPTLDKCDPHPVPDLNIRRRDRILTDDLGADGRTLIQPDHRGTAGHFPAVPGRL